MKKTLLLSLGFLLGSWMFCHAQEQQPAASETAAAAEAPATRASNDSYPISLPNYNQTDESQQEYYTGEGLSVNTPKSPNNIIYSGNQPDLYTGTVSATIPVYTYKDPDFTVPISLYYSSNGYQPNVAYDGLGVGWNVSGGGYVAQEVRGIPDYVPAQGGHKRRGYSTITQNLTNKSLLLSEHNVNDQCGYYTLEQWAATGLNTEMEPDIYHFNFMGHSGSFIQTGDKFHVFETNDPHGEYSIKIKPTFSSDKITYWMTMYITTGDGYVYVFRLNRYKYLSDVWGGAFWPALIFNYGTPTDYWMLYEVYAPNGRKMSFKYTTGHSVAYNTNNSEDIPGTAASVVIPKTEFHRNLTMKMAIKKITIDDVEILFDYKTRPSDKKAQYINYDKYYDKTSLSDASSNQYLSSIRVTKPAKSMQLGIPSVTVADNGLLKECTFNYRYSLGENRVMFLQSVKISGEGTYTMDYYGMTKRFPYHATYEVDHWGFYNGYKYLKDKKDIIDDASYERYGYLNQWPLDNGYVEETVTLPSDMLFSSFDFNTVQSRQLNLNCTMQGMLSKITYPTGGYTTFEYEQNEYQHLVTRDETSGNKPRFKTRDNEVRLKAGGLRVKKITDYPVEGTQISRTYSYETDGGICSGNLLVRPYYYITFKRYRLYPDKHLQGTPRYWLTNGLMERSHQPYHIEYASVVEKFDDGSFIRYDFANYRTHPDLYRSAGGNEVADSWSYLDTQYNDTNHFLSEVDFAPQFRGTLLTVRHYEKGGIIMKTEENIYDTTIARDFVENGKYSGSRCYVQRSYLESFPLKEQRVKEIFSSQGLSESIKYTYNALGQLVRSEKTQSNGDITYDNISYVSDINSSSQTAVQKLMVSRNILNLPLAKTRTVRFASRPSSELVANKETYEYADFRYNAGPGPISYIPICDIQNIKIDSIPVYNIRLKKVSSSSIDVPTAENSVTAYYVLMNYNKYDDAGRLLEKSDRNKLYTSYIWTKNGLFVVAEIAGAHHNDLPIIPQNVSIETEVPLDIQNKINAMSNVLTTFYQINPFVGITKITNPYGIVRGYKYNANRQLIGEYDANGNPIQTYSYSKYNQ